LYHPEHLNHNDIPAAMTGIGSAQFSLAVARALHLGLFRRELGTVNQCWPAQAHLFVDGL